MIHSVLPEKTNRVSKKFNLVVGNIQWDFPVPDWQRMLIESDASLVSGVDWSVEMMITNDGMLTEAETPSN